MQSDLLFISPSAALHSGYVLDRAMIFFLYLSWARPCMLSDDLLSTVALLWEVGVYFIFLKDALVRFCTRGASPLSKRKGRKKILLLGRQGFPWQTTKADFYLRQLRCSNI